MVYGAVVTAVPRLAPSNRNCTLAMPALAEADAVTVVTPETTAPLVGVVKETAGPPAAALKVATTETIS
jgi:hypothetical protein